MPAGRMVWQDATGTTRHSHADGDGTTELPFEPVVIATTGATDDAAAAGEFFPGGILYQATASVDEIDDGDIGRVRGTARRAVITAADDRGLSLGSAAPTPAGSDVITFSNAALQASDFTIRDTNDHPLIIPLSRAGWRNIWIMVNNGTSNWDQTVTMSVYGAYSSSGNSLLTLYPSLLANFSMITNGNQKWVVSSAGATGQGGTVGGSTTALYAHYSVPALENVPLVVINFKAAIAPTTGEVRYVWIRRST